MLAAAIRTIFSLKKVPQTSDIFQKYIWQKSTVSALLAGKFALRNKRSSTRMAPAHDYELAEAQNEHFELIYNGKVDNANSYVKYRSKRTGLTVVIGGVEGPLVSANFCIATEAFDDDGLPHTLEHLVFLGSELYPYKGVLDLVANRCLASGTNAWTDTDHTAYTVSNAGSEGFLTFMPIYLDHILFPTLNDEGFVTEVHHINGEGEDAGVVYSEMQGRENSGESLANLAILRAIYPGVCGYKSETGGIMKNLRESTDNIKVRAYHKQFYRPENLCLIITGQINPNDVFKALEPFEDKIVSKGERGPFERPWQTAVPPFEGPVELKVPFPTDDEESGMVYVAWRGPRAQNSYELTALAVLLEYLTDTAVAPLQQEFVEIDDPYANDVAFMIYENSVTCFAMTFEAVPTEKLNEVKPKLTEILDETASGKRPFDSKRMNVLLKRKILQVLSIMETGPHDHVIHLTIGDFLHGQKPEDLDSRLNRVPIFKRLQEEPDQFWLNLISKYMNRSSVTAVCNPSEDLMKEVASAEKSRIEKQREALGEDGLKEKVEQLQKAVAKNETPLPPSLLSSVAVPSTDSIHFHPIKRSCNHSPLAPDSNSLFKLSHLPFRFQLDDLHSNFVQMSVQMDTSKLPLKLRMYLPLLLEVMLESPVNRSGEIIPYEQVIAELQEDTIEITTSLGVEFSGSRFSCDTFAQVAQLAIKTERPKYQRGVQWLKDLLYNTQMTQDRVKIVASKVLSDVAERKRKGDKVVRQMLKDMNFRKDSNHYINSMIRQHSFLVALVKKLEASPDEVLNDLRALQKALTSLDNLTVHVSTDVKKLAEVIDPSLPWTQDFTTPKENFADGPNASLKLEYQPCHELVHSLESAPATNAIVGVGACESGYLMQSVPCVMNYSHPDVAPLLVFMQYLTQLEGPMWRQIRGQGLAYDFSFSIKQSEGLMYIVLYKASQLVSAYKEACEILANHINGVEKSEWTEDLLVSAKSSLVFDIIDEVKTVPDVGSNSLLSYYYGVDETYTQKLLAEVWNVSKDDLKRVGLQYVQPLLNPELSRCAVTCHPSKVKETVQAFKELKRDLVVLPSIEKSFMGKTEIE